VGLNGWRCLHHVLAIESCVVTADCSVAENGTSQVKLLKYVAIFDFKAQLDSELSLKEGEDVSVRSICVLTCF
jgi:hypothetical protein